MVREIVPNPEKLHQLVLYIATMQDDDPTFGLVKLNKLLFFCDFLAYLRLGSPITGVQYTRQDHGPVPEGMYSLLDQLDGTELLMQEVDYYGLPQRRPRPLVGFDVSEFSAEEIALVNALLEQYRGVTGTKISDKSHDFVGWKLAEFKEVIPYSVMSVGFREPSADEVRRGKELEGKAQAVLNGF